jgi:hypothetical protein
MNSLILLATVMMFGIHSANSLMCYYCKTVGVKDEPAVLGYADCRMEYMQCFNDAKYCVKEITNTVEKKNDNLGATEIEKKANKYIQMALVRKYCSVECKTDKLTRAGYSDTSEALTNFTSIKYNCCQEDGCNFANHFGAGNMLLMFVSVLLAMILYR